MKFVKTCVLCILSLFAVFQASAQSIVGAWTGGSTTVEGSSVLVFLANGYYYQIQNARASEGPSGFDGFERGTYTWNPVTGALTVTTIQDLNGDTGLSGLNGIAGFTFVVSGDSATATIPGTGTISATRVTSTGIVGGWSFGNAALPDSSAVLVLLPNGVYFEAEDGDSSAITGDPSGHDGIEHGTYAWNPTSGVFTSSRAPAPYADTNGEWGLSHTSPQMTVHVSPDGLTLTASSGPQDTFALLRIGTAASTPASLNFQGIWWNAPAESESGWGINLAHQGDSIFAAWYTYDANGRAVWFTMLAEKTGPNTYTGKLYENRGPALNAQPFNKDLVTQAEVGDGTLTFTDGENGTFRYTVKGTTQTKTLVRFVFGPVPTCTWGAQANLALATNYQDMWWATPPPGAESGWGVTLTHQGDVIFVAWFTYDLDGKPLWLTATVRKGAPGVYSGEINRTTGPAFSATPWDKNTVAATKIGDLTITFANGNHASFHYTLSLGAPPVAIDQTKTIERFVFRAPGTVCQ